MIDLEKYGVRTTSDTAAFLVGFSVGAIGDAVLNFAGFAEPLIVATGTGAAALGLKKLIFDTPENQRISRAEKEIALLEVQAEEAEENGDQASANAMRREAKIMAIKAK